MGCFGSRFSKRADAVSFLTNGLQFVGGESQHNGCPADYFVFRTTTEVEIDTKKVQVPVELLAQFPTADFKATDEAITKAVFIATHKEVSAVLADHNALKAKSSKDPLIGGKYKLSVAIAQLTAVLEAFKTANIEIPVEAKTKEVKEEEGENKEVKDGEEGENKEADGAGADNEGGDDEEVPAAGVEGADDAGKDENAEKEKVPSMDPGVYDSDDFSYEGWEAVPAIFLKQATVNPYFGDLVKGHIINHEFLQAKSKADKWNGAAGLITSALSTATRENAEAWFSGLVGDEDLEDLKSIAADGPILFPGWVAGWKSEANAIDHLQFIGAEDAQSKVHKVVFHVKDASTFGFAQCRLFSHRLEGTVASNKEDAGIWRFEVTGKAHDDATIAEWAAKAAADTGDKVKAVVVDPEAGKDQGTNEAAENNEEAGENKEA